MKIALLALALWSQYRHDPVAADVRYKNKIVHVQGKVKSVSATYTLYLDGDPGQVDGVTARPGDDQIVPFSRYHVGDTVNVTCLCAGIVFNEPVLIDCHTP